jgi:energy-coupling factor transporter transmembrane protein EcfT
MSDVKMRGTILIAAINAYAILGFTFKESIVRGLHLSLRTITVSMFGILLALTSEIVMIFYYHRRKES